MIGSLRGRQLIAGLAACSVGLAVNATATAAPPAGSGVFVALSDCSTPPVSQPGFIDALRVELAGASIPCCDPPPTGAAVGSPPVRVSLTFDVCQAEARRATVRVDDGAGVPLTRREVDLADVPRDARPRALALVAAELVRAVPASPPPMDSPVQSSPSAVAVVPIPPGDSRPEVAVSLGVDVLVRAHPARDTVMGGARLWLSGALGRWQLEGAADGATGRNSYPPGTVSVSALGAGVTVSRRWAPGAITLAAGLGADAAATWITGRAADPGVATDSDAGLTGAVRVRLAIERRILGIPLFQRAVLDGGVMLAPVDAYVDGARAAGTSGWFVIGAIGFGYALDGTRLPRGR